MELSQAARAMWAKKSDDGQSWLPLSVHLTDTMMVMDYLWNNWLSPGIRQLIADDLGGPEAAQRLLRFCAAAHDIGKATPVFFGKCMHVSGQDTALRENELAIVQRAREAEIPVKPYALFHSPERMRHGRASALILLRVVKEKCTRERIYLKGVASVIAAHHGMPPSENGLGKLSIEENAESVYLEKKGREIWTSIQQEYVHFAMEAAGVDDLCTLPEPGMHIQVIICGLLIMADWLASNSDIFPTVPPDNFLDDVSPYERLSDAEDALSFLCTLWDPAQTPMNAEQFPHTFGFPANEVQRQVLDLAADMVHPGIFVLEAETGIGKTEAALALAQTVAARTGRDGIYFALPTQATSDGMFGRIEQWISHLGQGAHSIALMHGKAQFNEDYTGLAHYNSDEEIYETEGGYPVVADWFAGRKKSMLADFTVGTVDQLLMAALRQRHLMLRHLGLANKVVIVDECHAFDAFMNEYLKRALHWMGVYGVPVILLSATLPQAIRRELVCAYMGRKADAPAETAYPLLTYSDGTALCACSLGSGGRNRIVQIDRVQADALAALLKEKLAQGGCAGIIVNTVSRAQALRKALGEFFPEKELCLIHSRFLAPQRAAIETDLRRKLGKPGFAQRPYRLVVIGTQVLEQSLDIDFDLLITDIAPVDLLIQRMGRLHRHQRPRPEGLEAPRCLIIDRSDEREDASAFIYSEYLLLRTRLALPETIQIPEDVPHLIEEVYGDADPAPLPEGYEKVKEAWEFMIADKEARAKSFRIGSPYRDKDENLCGWIDIDAAPSDALAQARVRDGDPTLEVAVIRQNADGSLTLWDGTPVPRGVPKADLAQSIAQQCLRLPRALCTERRMHMTEQTLADQAAARIPEWQKSVWLRELPVMILDESGQLTLTYSEQTAFTVSYKDEYGLIYERMEDDHAK